MKNKLIRLNEFINANWKIFLFLTLALQVFLLIFVFLRADTFFSPDSYGYMAPAESFLEKGIMLDNDGLPIWFRTPGYPLFLAIIYGLSNHSNICVLVVQMIMCLLNTLMIFYTVKNLTQNNNTFGILAALFYVLDFAIYDHAVRILTDIPFAFLITLTAFLFVKYLLSHKNFYAVLCIFVINYALLLRPAVMYLNIIIAVILLLMMIFKKIDWKMPCLYLLVFIALFGGWLARNHYYHNVPFCEDMYTPLRSRDFFILYAPLTYEMAGGAKYDSDETKEYFKNLLYAKYPNFDKFSKPEQYRAQKDIGKTYMLQNIKAFIKLYFWGLTKELIAPDFYRSVS